MRISATSPERAVGQADAAVPVAPTPRPSFGMDRDNYFPTRGVAGSLNRTASDTSTTRLTPTPFGLEAGGPSAPVAEPRPRHWWIRWQKSCDQSMTLRTVMRFVPVAAICLTTTALYFGYENWRTLENSRATAILRQLQPILLRAHENIMGAVASIQRKLDIPTMPPNGTQPGP